MTVAGSAAALTKVINDTTKELDITEASLDAKVTAVQASEAAAGADKTEAEGYRDEAAAHAVSVAADLTTVLGNVTFEGIGAILAEKAVNAVDVFVYDTSLDSDGGAWRKRCQHTSWYNETLNTATRGSCRDFPAVAVIVAEAAEVTIYDGDDPSLPMWRVSDFTGYSAREVSALNGSVGVATNLGVSMLSYAAGDVSVVPKFSASSTPALPSSDVRSVSLVADDEAPSDPASGLPVPTIQIGINGTGIRYLRHSTTLMSAGFYSGEITKISSQSKSYIAAHRPIGGSLSALGDGAVHFHGDSTYRLGLYRPDGVQLSAYSAGGLRSGLLHSILFDPTGRKKDLTAIRASTFLSGWMPSDIEGAFLADTDDTDLVGTNHIANPDFSDDASGYETFLGATIELDAGRGKVIGDGTQYCGVFPNFADPSVMEAGVVYELSFDFEPGTYTGSIGLSADGQNASPAGSVLGTAAAQRVTAYLVPSVLSNGSNGRRMRIRIDAAHQAGDYFFISNVRYRRAEPDRSVVNKAMHVNGTIMRSPVADGAELVGYSGFSAANYLEQPYNSALDFGAGDFCVMGWHKSTGSNNNADIFARTTLAPATDDRIIRLTRWSLGRYSFGVSRFGIGGDSVEYQAGNITHWAHIVCIRRSGTLELWLDGRLVAFGPSATDASQLGAVLRLGQYTYSLQGSAALWRISATAPTAAQIRKIYEDERKLFQPGAKCTLYGTSDAVTALAHDPKTRLLHVGTSQGRSVFDGLLRVANTETPVGTAISAVNGLIAEQ